MTEFYRRLWEGGESKALALWNAKMAMRKEGARVADWAAWVLTGAPE
jgi:CHAT domain-containing protein